MTRTGRAARTARPGLRRTASATVALVLACATAGCGGDDASDADPAPSSRASETTTPATTSPTGDVPATPPSDPATDPASDPASTAPVGVLDEDVLRTALITAADLPGEFVEDPTAGDEDDGDNPFDGTCLADVGQFSDALGQEPDAEAETELDNPDGTLSIDSQVEAYLDQGAVATAFASFTDDLQQCTEVTTTTDDGISYDLRIAYDDAVDLPGADDQLAFDITGTVSVGADTVDLDYRFVVGLLGPYISVLGTFAAGDDVMGLLDMTQDLAAVQAQRVVDLA